MRLPLFIIACISLLFASCSEYQKVLRKDDMGKKYAMADSLYNKGKYKKALKLMEQLVPAYRGKPQGEKLAFIYANTFFELGDYYAAGYQFERFTQAYPKSDSTELASFKSAKSVYNLSERYSLDQKETYRGMEKLQGFINSFPDSEMRPQANEMVTDLRLKLEKKQFETAKQYFQIEDYKAAIESFDNFITDNPGTSYREQAFLYRLKAAYKLAINSLPYLVQERLVTARGYYNNYIKYYKDTDSASEAKEINENIEKRLVSSETKPTI